jgi:site-specific DNA recombinase
MRAVCYYRFSTANKAQWDNSEKRQQATCTEYCMRQGWPIVKEVTDLAKSGLLDKPNLEKLKAEVESGEVDVDVIVVDDAARLSRRNVLMLYKDIGWIDEYGIKIYIMSVGGEPLSFEEIGQDPKLLLDQWANNREVKETSRKVSNGMLEKFQAGTLGWIGQAPLGYDLRRQVDAPSHLVANEDLKIATRIYLHILEGGSIRDGVKILCESKRFKDKQARSSEVKDPNSTSVRNLLRNPIYCGKRTFGVRNVPKVTGGGVNKHNPKWTKSNPLAMTDYVQEYSPEGFDIAISYEEWSRVQQMLDENQKTHSGKGFRRKANHNYHGLLYCGNCGAAMVQDQWRNPRTGEVIYYFLCNAAKQKGPRCREVEPWSKRVRQSHLDRRLRLEFKKLFIDPDTHIKMIDAYIKMLKVESSKKEQREGAVDIETKRQRLGELNKLYAEVGAESLLQSIRDLSLEIDRQEKSLQMTPQEVNMLEIAKRQFEKGIKEGGFAKYVGRVYATAYAMYQKPKLWTTKKDKVRIAKKLALSFVNPEEQGLEIAGGVKSKVNLGEFEDAGACVDMLREMGCKAILINWTLGERKGKAAQIATSMEFEFSLGITDHTDILVVASTERKELISLA